MPDAPDTPRRRGRKPQGERALTPTERVRAFRERRMAEASGSRHDLYLSPAAARALRGIVRRTKETVAQCIERLILEARERMGK